jgi:hypothetical protein
VFHHAGYAGPSTSQLLQSSSSACVQSRHPSAFALQPHRPPTQDHGRRGRRRARGHAACGARAAARALRGAPRARAARRRLLVRGCLEGMGELEPDDDVTGAWLAADMCLPFCSARATPTRSAAAGRRPDRGRLPGHVRARARPPRRRVRLLRSRPTPAGSAARLTSTSRRCSTLNTPARAARAPSLAHSLGCRARHARARPPARARGGRGRRCGGPGAHPDFATAARSGEQVFSARGALPHGAVVLPRADVDDARADGGHALASFGIFGATSSRPAARSSGRSVLDARSSSRCPRATTSSSSPVQSRHPSALALQLHQPPMQDRGLLALASSPLSNAGGIGGAADFKAADVQHRNRPARAARAPSLAHSLGVVRDALGLARPPCTRRTRPPPWRAWCTPPCPPGRPRMRASARFRRWPPRSTLGSGSWTSWPACSCPPSRRAIILRAGVRASSVMASARPRRRALVLRAGGHSSSAPARDRCPRSRALVLRALVVGVDARTMGVSSYASCSWHRIA